MTEVIAIGEAILSIIEKRLSNVIIESNSQLTIEAIRGDIKAPIQIYNLVESIRVRAKVVNNVNLLNRFIGDSINRLYFLIINKISPFCF